MSEISPSPFAHTDLLRLNSAESTCTRIQQQLQQLTAYMHSLRTRQRTIVSVSPANGSRFHTRAESDLSPASAARSAVQRGAVRLICNSEGPAVSAGAASAQTLTS